MFWASKRWPVKYSPHNYVEKLTSNIVWPSGSSPTFDQMGATDGEQSLLHVGNIQVLDLFRKPNSWQLFPKAQSLDQFWKLKILDVDGIEVAIPWIADLVNTSYVVISRETERFVNEIHDQKEKRTVHFDMLMDICHLKNAELEPKNQTYKGWVVLRSDIVKKNDSGSHAVFTEQGSSASQMTAAECVGCYCKVTRLWRTSSRRNVSSRPSKVGGRSQNARNSKVRMSRGTDMSSATRVTQIMVKHWRPRGSSRTIFVRTPTRRSLVGKTVRGSSLWTGMEKKYRIGNVCLCIEEQRLLSVFVDDIKMAGRQQNVAPMWKKLMKLVDLGEPTSLLDHVHLGCTQRECGPNENNCWVQRNVRITIFCWCYWKNYQDGRNLTQKRLRGLTTWKDMLESAWKDTVSWRTKRPSSCANRVQNPENSQECQKYVNPFSSSGRPVRGCVCVRALKHREICARDREPTNLQGRSWTTTICKSPTIRTLRKSSRTFDRSWIVRRTKRYLIQKSMCWSGDNLCQQRWKQQYFLGTSTMTIRLLTGTPIAKNSRPCSTSRRGWSWIRTSRFWMFPRLNWNLLHGWDLHILHDKVIKGESKGTRLLRFSSLSGRMHEHSEANVKWKDQLVHRIQRFIWDRRRTKWVRAGYFHRTYNIADSPTNQDKLEASQSRRIWRSNHLHVHDQRQLFGRRKEILQNVFRIPRRSRITQKKASAWTLVIPRSRRGREFGMERTISQTWRTVEFYCRCHGGKFQRKWTSSNPGHRCVETRILEKERWKMYDPLQCGIFECRALLSHNSLSKSAQYLRSSGELMWRIDSADTWSNAREHGHVRCEGKRSVISKVGTAQYRHQGGMIKQRETACVFIIKDLKNCRRRSTSRKPVNLRDSWGESPSECTDDSWTPDAGWFCTKSYRPTHGCSGPWLHTVDWVKNGNRNIEETCMVLWHYDGILPL